MTTILIHLDNPNTGAVSWKAKDAKGSRWRKAKDIYDACKQADESMPTPRDIDFVTKKD